LECSYTAGAVRQALIFPIAVSMFCASTAVAQKPPSQPDMMVKLQLSALDPRGEPITDLRQGECQVADDGRRETITFFHYDGNRRHQTSPIGPKEYSNRGRVASRATVILLDLLSERLMTWGQAGEEIVKSLLGLESGDGLYFYVLTSEGSFYPVHPLPKNQEELRAANPAWTQQMRALFDVVSRDLGKLRPPDDQDPVWRAQLTLRALTQFASYVAAIPGPKSLIWITHGVPSAVMINGELVDFSPQLQKLGEAFAHTGTAVYTVAQSASGAGAALGYSWDTLQLLSGLTGGRAYSSDSAGVAIQEALADARGSYMVGYYPHREQGKYHKIRITCARKGVRLQTKQGYWDFRVGSRPAERESVIFENAAVSPFDDSGIGLSAKTTAVVTGSAPGTVQVRIRVNSADLMLPLRDDRFIGDLVAGIATYSASGAVQQVTTAASPLSLTQEQSDQAAKNGIEILRNLTIDDATENIRVVVFDRSSNQTGSLTIPRPRR
jgi:VWFA-related protein